MAGLDSQDLSNLSDDIDAADDLVPSLEVNNVMTITHWFSRFLYTVFRITSALSVFTNRLGKGREGKRRLIL